MMGSQNTADKVSVEVTSGSVSSVENGNNSQLGQSNSGGSGVVEVRGVKSEQQNGDREQWPTSAHAYALDNPVAVLGSVVIWSGTRLVNAGPDSTPSSPGEDGDAFKVLGWSPGSSRANSRRGSALGSTEGGDSEDEALSLSYHGPNVDVETDDLGDDGKLDDDVEASRSGQSKPEDVIGTGMEGELNAGEATRVAVHIIDLEEAGSLESLGSELSMWERLGPLAGLRLHRSFVRGTKCWMITEPANRGVLADILVAHYQTGMPEDLVLAIGAAVLEGIRVRHGAGIVHRGIEPRSVFVDVDELSKAVKISLGPRLGTSCVDLHEGGDIRGRATGLVGNLAYGAPEMIAQAYSYGTPADIWSFGMLLITLATGVAPWDQLPPGAIFLAAMRGVAPSLTEQGAGGSREELAEVIALCLQRDPGARPSAESLAQHRWFRGAGRRNTEAALAGFSSTVHSGAEAVGWLQRRYGVAALNGERDPVPPPPSLLNDDDEPHGELDF